MSELVLVIGNKNYSSWSLRPWLALTATGAPFREQMIWLDGPTTKAQILRHSRAGRVPVLHDGDQTVWESLAICEYVAERFPEAGLWPDDAMARALARSAASEMHAGFSALRRELPMDMRRRTSKSPSTAAWSDIERICEIWRDARHRHGESGPYLFGRFSIADCMFAPVASRFVTYGIELDRTCAAYRDAIMEREDMRRWAASAVDEPALPDP